MAESRFGLFGMKFPGPHLQWRVILRTSQWTSGSSAQRRLLPPIIQPNTSDPSKPVSMDVSLPPLTLLKDYPNPRGDKKKELHIDQWQAIAEDCGGQGHFFPCPKLIFACWGACFRLHY